MKKILWVTMVIAALLIGFFPLLNLMTDNKFGILDMKSESLLSDIFYNIGFYTHIIGAAVALLIGWVQFSSKLRIWNLKWHQKIGKLYVITSLLSSMASIYIGFYASGGLISAVGFITLGAIWFWLTAFGFIAIINRRIAQHQELMVYSYACCFAGVTLRLYLPVLIIYFGDFILVYKVVAWLSWVPNLFVASLIIKSIKRKQASISSL
jgi:hypothetical protein